MTAASSAGPLQDPDLARPRPSSWLSERSRERAAKAGIAAACLLLCFATAVRFATVLVAAPNGLDALSAAWLFALVCRTLFYVLVCWFTLLRRPAVKRTQGWRPRAAALLGTFAVLGFGLLPPAPVSAAWHFVSALLFLIGTILAVVVLMRLGRSLTIMPEARRLVTSGPYRFVRHPLYLVEELAAIAGFIEAFSLAGAVLFAAQLALQLCRIANEEAVLESAFPDYARYKATTARLVPGLW